MREPLLHFSIKPLVSVHSVNQNPDDIQMKPDGLWVSAGHGEDSWPSWCRSERFGLERFTHVTEIVLGEDARILYLEGHDAITGFDAVFGETPSWCYWRTYISWYRVAERYQGIVIAPYIWSQRMGDCFWYYTWDCASGCIWDASAIAELRPILGLDLRMEEAADA